uniref:Latent transforming growth factor beta binding protein 2 n=1 Tax=Oncorhynchus tshawytscha TaxID=74940 RepID=A0AAZ3Q122_ONCTS
MQLFSRAALLLFTQVSVCLCAPGANLTSSLDRIKIVFTPMVCRRVCSGGRCYNSCEKGDTTTVYSENQQQHQPAKTQVFCQIPCLNGGRCIGRDQCWCPTNSTGKFCHLPAPPPARPTLSRKDGSLAGHNSSSHSMYTLPLSNQQDCAVRSVSCPASLHPSMVNVHIQHPHEAEVQIHQVARVKPGQRPPAAEGAHSVQQRSQPGNGIGNGHGHTRPHNRQNGYVGRCFQETVDGQCGKPLPGLTKQDDCCGSVGASWGLNKCTECPTKPAYAVIANGQVECPKGYKRMNMTHCQDINECLMNGICKNAECLNTRGSYRCTCKPGYMLDPARSHCVSDKAVSDQRGMCYRSASAGICSLPLAQHITKQICCCSRVGKAWGTACERCPLPDTDHFKEICPAGHGYTYSTGVSWEAQNPSHHQLPQQPAQPPQQLPHVPQIPQYPYHRQPHQPQHTQHPHQPQHPQHPQEIPHHPQTPQYPHQSHKPHHPQHPQELPQTPQIPQYPHTPNNHNTLSIQTQTPSIQLGRPPASLKVRTIILLDVNECLDQSACAHGRCVNSEGSYSCSCYQGYQASLDNSSCQEAFEVQGVLINVVNSEEEWWFNKVLQHMVFSPDVDECLLPGACLHGRCVNLDGSHRCSCNPGYQSAPDGRACEDVDECATPVCPAGICTNSEGSYSCKNCRPGFQRSAGGQRCEGMEPHVRQCVASYCSFFMSICHLIPDVDECSKADMCLGGVCANTEGSFTCTRCKDGYRVSQDRQRCEDIDECQSGSVCANGICLNSEGSFSCITCPSGYSVSLDGELCEDIDECELPTTCPKGTCTNTEGSFTCTTCGSGYRVTEDGLECDDINECLSPGVCPMGVCSNTEGSYSCMTCDLGFTLAPNGLTCEDIDECVNETICGDHGFCENTDGSYRCQCDQGYSNPPGDTGAHSCVDVNECEMSTALCGEALCENVDGSFLCICPSDNEEFDPITSQCPSPTEEQRKECYYNLNDANFCDNVLSRNTTKQECCCTVGAGWGDDCEIHPCPVPGREEYDQLCPHGSGLLPQAVFSHSLEQQSFKDVDECKMFGPDICKNGRCSNNFSSYSCFCRTGFYYDNIRLECVDYDECLTEKECVDGVCVNTAGSFDCFCSPPLVLDTTRRRCVSVNTTEETHEPEEDIHLDICWQGLVDERMCAQPLIGRRTTYTECCCLYGVAWSEQCAFCPMRDSDDYAAVCNLPRRGGSDSLRERPGYEYDRFDGFEGLRAEECGILNGCENGRCVRVREGYTCDCFDGYELDLTKMACIDINECEDISDNVALCKNGACTNTEGSYKCICLPGFQASAKPHECIPEVPVDGFRERVAGK